MEQCLLESLFFFIIDGLQSCKTILVDLRHDILAGDEVCKHGSRMLSQVTHPVRVRLSYSTALELEYMPDRRSSKVTLSGALSDFQCIRYQTKVVLGRSRCQEMPSPGPQM